MTREDNSSILAVNSINYFGIHAICKQLNSKGIEIQQESSLIKLYTDCIYRNL